MWVREGKEGNELRATREGRVDQRSAVGFSSLSG